MDDRMMSENPEHEGHDDNMASKITNEEYKIWKKNSVWLYDMIYARALEWPTMTCQWFPDKKEVEGTNFTTQRILFGTVTSDQAPNYLQIAQVDIPTLFSPDLGEYNEQRGEIGGYGAAKKPFEFKVIQKINHPGDVNRARYMPQNPNIIASMGGEKRTLIFDRTKHTSSPGDQQLRYELELAGHTGEGYGLCWSPHDEGKLVTGTEDNTVRLWDIKSSFTKGVKSIESIRTYTHHSAVVNDVEFHPKHNMWIGTVSDDLTFQVIDTRMPTTKKGLYKKEAHTDAVNCLAFHPDWDPIVATGSADKTIALWDLRCLDSKLHSCEAHKDNVISLEWHPTERAILGSGGYDRRVLMWDISKMGDEQTEEEAEDGPPELLFMHGGFTNSICEFSWNKNNPWVMVAAAEDNQMQIFRPAKALVETSKKKVARTEVSE